MAVRLLFVDLFGLKLGRHAHNRQVSAAVGSVNATHRPCNAFGRISCIPRNKAEYLAFAGPFVQTLHPGLPKSLERAILGGFQLTIITHHAKKILRGRGPRGFGSLGFTMFWVCGSGASCRPRKISYLQKGGVLVRSLVAAKEVSRLERAAF